MRVNLSIILMSVFALVSCGKHDNQYQGYVEAENIYLASPYGGILKQALVKRGMRVKKGDLLFVLDPNPQSFSLQDQTAGYNQSKEVLQDLKKPKRKQELDSVQAQIDQAQAQINLATLRVKRNQILFDKHVMDRDTLDAALERLRELTAVKAQYESNLALAKLGARTNQIIAQEFAVESFLSKLQLATWQAEQKKIVAPADGIIFDTYYKPGEYVGAERAVCTLLTHQNTRIEFFVPLQGIVHLFVGKEIQFYYENNDVVSKAVISYISPEAEYMPPLVYSRDNHDKIVFRIKAQVNDSKRLFPGEPVVVTVDPQHG